MRRASFRYIVPLLFLNLPFALAQDVDANRQEQILFDGQVQVPPTKRYEVRFATSITGVPNEQTPVGTLR